MITKRLKVLRKFPDLCFKLSLPVVAGSDAIVLIPSRLLGLQLMSVEVAPQVFHNYESCRTPEETLKEHNHW